MSTNKLIEVQGVSEEAGVFNTLPVLSPELLYQKLYEELDESVTSFDQFPSPYDLKDMDTAVEIFMETVVNNGRILCVSDSDCDGMGTLVLFQLWFFYSGYTNVEFTIAKRDEGYGFQSIHVDRAAVKPDLVITADNGITAHKASEYCKNLGIKTIITDHHQVNHRGVPDADAVIDPHRPDCPFYRFGRTDHPDNMNPSINGTFVLWFFLKALTERMGMKIDMNHMFLPELVLTTISDVMPIRGINRFVVKYGLSQLLYSDRTWVRTFLEGQGKVTAEDFSFGLIPSINSAGRLQDPAYAGNFLRAADYGTSKQWLTYLTDLNNHRKELQEDLDKEVHLKYADWLVHDFILIPGSGERFNKGIVGVCAGRIAEKYNKPTIILKLSDCGTYYSGSGRSVGTVNLLGIVQKSAYIDKDKTGGHKAACGVTFPADKLELFWSDLQRETAALPRSMFRPKINAIGKLEIRNITLDLFLTIDKFEPFGEGYSKPAFVAEGIFKEVTYLGKLKNHMKGVVEDGAGARVPFVWFFFNEKIKNNTRKKFMFVISKDKFASEKSGQLEINIQIKSIISNI